jgi:hypothetical protein
MRGACVRFTARLRRLDSDAAAFVRDAPPIAFTLFAARALAVLTVIYAVGLGLVVIAGSPSPRADVESVLFSLVAVPWCAIPLAVAVRGRGSWVWASGAVVLGTTQTLMFLPAYGYGVVYAPIALAGLVVTVLTVTISRSEAPAANAQG